MAGDTIITVVGNLTADPELRFTPAGNAVCSFTLASTPRSFDRKANEWKDAETLFLRCTVWREAAENVAESLRKGMRVIAQGRLTQHSWETDAGERRTSVEMQVNEVGPSLRRARARVERSGGQTPSQQAEQWPGVSQPSDPWQRQGQGDAASEPPF